jgi:hypothetical protein
MELKAIAEANGLAESQVLTMLVRLAYRGGIKGMEALRPDAITPTAAPPSAPDNDEDEDDGIPF